MNAAGAPYGTAIRMIAYARHREACRFVSQMTAHIWPFMRSIAWPVIVTTTIVTNEEQFKQELQAPAALTLVSAHGPARGTPAARFSRIGDGTRQNRIEFGKLSRNDFAGFGARAGMIWDACYAGQPQFRQGIAPLSLPDVVHIGPSGEIEYDDSVHMATTILHALLAPGSPPITPDAVAAAAAITAGSAAIKLKYGPLEGTQAP